MGRTKIAIDKSELLQAIRTVESAAKFTTRQALAETIAASDWAKNFQPKPITAAVVLLRIQQFGLGSEIATPKGKRGRAKGTILSTEQKAAMRAGRGQNFQCSNIGQLRKEFPESRQGLLNKVERGSLRATINAYCLQCSNFQSDEIRNCSVTGCALYSIRPYQNSKKIENMV